MHPHDSTQESLDEGVEKMRGIFNSFKDVGLKDRSMIWNSYETCCTGKYYTTDAYIVTSWRPLNFAISSNALFRLLQLLPTARSPVVRTLVKISQRSVVNLLFTFHVQFSDLCPVARRRKLDEAHPHLE